MNWKKYAPYFSEKEFRCKHTGLCFMNEEFMDKLLALRLEYGSAMTITSGYRDTSHPAEAGKSESGAHTTGRACDVAVSHGEAWRLMGLSFKHGFTGVGVQQKGDGRFVHLDDIQASPTQPRPTVWSY
ncbi:D-Ala-D-Ala carboxypeptidase family metallohydrolase [Leptospira sp. 96542]|nr:D-Ala-D-Ala carboxypeptidase family metallohydrolase [Leptospira sp. 96542]